MAWDSAREDTFVYTQSNVERWLYLYGVRETLFILTPKYQHLADLW